MSRRNYAAPVEADIFQPDGEPASFVVSLFGVPLRDVITVSLNHRQPSGSWVIKQALGKALVKEGYHGSLFAIKENR